MGYKLEISDELDKKFDKLSRKNKRQLEIIDKKVQQILLNPYYFKSLRGHMKNIRRVHIDKSFVLTYKIFEVDKIIKLLDFDHHDKVYRK
ncbi:MAG: type II toxin-antitoxin system mRNA interferase toxin, RelE/StbE family [archaeon]